MALRCSRRAAYLCKAANEKLFSIFYAPVCWDRSAWSRLRESFRLYHRQSLKYLKYQSLLLGMGEWDSVLNSDWQIISTQTARKRILASVDPLKAYWLFIETIFRLIEKPRSSEDESASCCFSRILAWNANEQRLAIRLLFRSADYICMRLLRLASRNAFERFIPIADFVSLLFSFTIACHRITHSHFRPTHGKLLMCYWL